jgi:ATP-dependent DNA helicase RecQ
MKDQVDALAQRGIAAARLDSSLGADDVRQVMEQVRSGQLRLLYVAPERFNNERFCESIRHIHIALFAIDEAHCISEWGHNFRPDYLKLAEFARLCGAERVLGLTATATPSVLDDICQQFGIAPESAVRTGFYRDNLTVLTTPVTAAQRDTELVQRLQSRPPGPTIVYVTLQRTAEDLASHLAQLGMPARFYHAGMDDKARAAAQEWLMASERAVMVATIAFGMGIDKADIRYVYHYNAPKSLENFSQEIGRAGRDGQPATCEMFACMDDLNVLENFVYGDTPSQASVQGLVQAVLALGDAFDVSYYELANEHDIRPLVTRTLMTYLELDGFIVGATPFYSTFQFKPLCSSQAMLEPFDAARRAFLREIFRHAKKARTWFHLDVDQTALALGCPRQRIIRALDYLGEQQMLELKVAGVRHRYRTLRLPDNPAALAQALYQRMLERERRDIERLQQVFDLVQRDGCQVSALGAYFGEPLETPCGHCSWCQRGQTPTLLAARSAPAIDEQVWRDALELRQTESAVLFEPRALTRLLCGVTSPRLVRAKLTRHALFGALSPVPFQVVLERAQSA